MPTEIPGPPTVNRVNPFANLEADLDRLSTLGRRRRLESMGGLDFTSNDYLALAASTELNEAARAAISRGVPIGSGGSRLLRGNHPEHVGLEQAAADFFGVESALYFGSGYAANQTLFSTALCSPRPHSVAISSCTMSGFTPASMTECAAAELR
jgi:7-keto-8-aminopelargonate synthetase-like enzyme